MQAPSIRLRFTTKIIVVNRNIFSVQKYLNYSKVNIRNKV